MKGGSAQQHLLLHLGHTCISPNLMQFLIADLSSLSMWLTWTDNAMSREQLKIFSPIKIVCLCIYFMQSIHNKNTIQHRLLALRPCSSPVSTPATLAPLLAWLERFFVQKVEDRWWLVLWVQSASTKHHWHYSCLLCSKCKNLIPDSYFHKMYPLLLWPWK